MRNVPLLAPLPELIMSSVPWASYFSALPGSAPIIQPLYDVDTRLISSLWRNYLKLQANPPVRAVVVGLDGMVNKTWLTYFQSLP